MYAGMGYAGGPYAGGVRRIEATTAAADAPDQDDDTEETD